VFLSTGLAWVWARFARVMLTDHRVPTKHVSRVRLEA
jgi:hypothetical protein